MESRPQRAAPARRPGEAVTACMPSWDVYDMQFYVVYWALRYQTCIMSQKCLKVEEAYLLFWLSGLHADA